MTVIKPNAIAGINSITVASGAALAVHKADGTLIQTLSGAAGVSTFTSVSVGSATTSNSAAKSINIGLGASIAQHDVNTLTFGTNGDPRVTIDASGNFNVGSAATIKAGGNATFSGIVTATAFKGDGSGLSGVTAVTINSNADNRIITGSGSANTLNGESNLTFDGSNTLAITGPEGGAARVDLICDEGDDAADKVRLVHTSGNEFKIQRTTSHTDSLAIDGSGNSQFAGQVKVSSSNASTVAFSVGDTNTGFYNAGSNIFGYSVSGSEKLRIDASGRVQIGHTASIVGGRVEIHAATAETQLTINESSDSGTGPAFYLNRTRGSNLSSPSPIEDGNYMGRIIFGSYDTNSYEKGASIEARADGQTWSDGDCPARLQFLTTPDGSTTPTERLRIHATGQVSVGEDVSNAHDYKFVVKPNRTDSNKAALGLLVDGDSGQGGGVAAESISAKIVNTNTFNNSTHQYAAYIVGGQQYTAPVTACYVSASGTYNATIGMRVELNKNIAASADGFSYYSKIIESGSGAGVAYHFRGEDNGSIRINIEKDGDIKNTNNSYGSLSDVKLKENIVDANSQWDDIKALRIRNFNFKDDPDKVKLLGVVAQEAEVVSAGLVDTSNDIEVDDMGMGTVTGTTKYVKYSILYMKAVKALQEAQTRIETLETKVAALEGG